MSKSADIIKQNVSMRNILDRYGLKLNRRGAMCCPFHREKTASFKLYSNGTKFHCFGCGADGDVITFVMRYYGIGYAQAITRVAAEFGIPIIGARPLTLRERVKAQETRRKQKQEDAELEREYNRLFETYLLECDEFSRLSHNLTKYAPKSPEEPFNELYCDAIYKLPLQKYKCEVAQITLRNFEERRFGRFERDNSGPGI